ncbi:uncharacterized protein LOC134747245 [Cydia strobilella]|uniref:uncharacterized protein LOC134747245 n=1 Tax=Cydia strobilella TaxID=1100964 RepID=UPI00300754E2
MPRKPCYWTRKLELDLVEFVRQRDFIWKPFGNTNHHIQQKYKAYAEFAAKLGGGFTARSVRDRWVNIRSTYNHNVRRIERSRETAKSLEEVYVPCWPLWKPLQFLRESSRKDDVYEGYAMDFKETDNVEVKVEFEDTDDPELLQIRQRGQRTDRPRRRAPISKKKKNTKCKKVLDDLLIAMKPLVSNIPSDTNNYWFFSRHVTERLNCMRDEDALAAGQEIMKLLEWPGTDIT